MAAPTESTGVPCDDFLLFQESLKRCRLIDDRIVNALNAVLPTQSFASKVNSTTECKRLYEELDKSYKSRDVAIKKCISKVSVDVDQLRAARMEEPDDVELLKKLRKTQTKLRLMQQELNVEEVLKDRSTKVFYERCRDAYTPPESKPPV